MQATRAPITVLREVYNRGHAAAQCLLCSLLRVSDTFDQPTNGMPIGLQLSIQVGSRAEP